MTTTVIVHNAFKSVRVITEDRVYDHDKNALSDAWKHSGAQYVAPGQLYQTYCTDTRRVIILEPSQLSDVEAKGQ